MVTPLSLVSPRLPFCIFCYFFSGVVAQTGHRCIVIDDHDCKRDPLFSTAIVGQEWDMLYWVHYSLTICHCFSVALHT